MYIQQEERAANKRNAQEPDEEIIKTLVWSVLTYGAEIFTQIKADTNILEAFEVLCWRRLLKVNWTEKVRNEEILRVNA